MVANSEFPPGTECKVSAKAAFMSSTILFSEPACLGIA
jgi:hypothetical protein